MCCFVVVKMVHNVLQIGDGRDFQHRILFGDLNFRLPQNCQAETKPRLLPMCCYTLLLLRLYFASNFVLAFCPPFLFVKFIIIFICLCRCMKFIWSLFVNKVLLHFVKLHRSLPLLVMSILSTFTSAWSV